MASSASATNNDEAISLSNTNAVAQWHCPQTSITRHLGTKTHSTTTPSTHLIADIRLDPLARTLHLSLRLRVDLTAFIRPTTIHLPILVDQIASVAATHIPARSAPPAVHNTFVQRRVQKPSTAANHDDDDEEEDDGEDEQTIIRLVLSLSSPLAPVGPSPRTCGGPPAPRDRRARAALAALHSLCCLQTTTATTEAAANSQSTTTTTTTTAAATDEPATYEQADQQPTDRQQADHQQQQPQQDTPHHKTQAPLTLFLPAPALAPRQLAALTAALTARWPPPPNDPLKAPPSLRRMYGGKGAEVLGRDVLGAAVKQKEERQDSPPSYDEIGPGPSPPPSSSSGRKRKGGRRAGSPVSAGGEKRARVRGEAGEGGIGEGDGVAWKGLREEVCGLRAEMEALRRLVGGGDLLVEALERKLDALGAKVVGAEEKAAREVEAVRSGFERRLEGQRREFEERLEAQARLFDERLEAQKQLFDEKMEEAEARWGEQYEEWEERMDKQMEDHFDGVRIDTDQAIGAADVRWEDEMLGAKNELRDFVREEMKEVEHNIKDEFRNGRANVLIDFS